MKKCLLIIAAVLTLCYTGCKKDSGNSPSSADSYLPLTQGSSWTYFSYQQGGHNDTLNVIMSGATTNFNGKKYYNFTTTAKLRAPSTSYYYAGNHILATRYLNAFAGTTIELQLYNDTVAVGHSWVSSPTDNGLVSMIPARTVSTIKKMNDTRVFGGKTYTGVIYTQVDFQYDYGTGYQTSFTYNYYLAKGIGILGYNLSAIGELFETEGILSYAIK